MNSLPVGTTVEVESHGNTYRGALTLPYTLGGDAQVRDATAPSGYWHLQAPTCVRPRTHGPREVAETWGRAKAMAAGVNAVAYLDSARRKARDSDRRTADDYVRRCTE